jgi:cardiolipin synthase
MDAVLDPWWIAALAGIGLAALLGGLVSLLTSIGGGPRSITATETPSVDDPGFLAAIAGVVNAPIGTGGQVALLENGDAIFAALVAAIDGAAHSVNISVYHWEGGRAHGLILRALLDAAGRGVEVRVLLDGMGGFNAPDDDMDRLRAAGARVVTFRPVKPSLLFRFHKRNHRRAIVVDGRVGFTGGAAIADKWLGDARTPEEWRDTMVRVTGPLATGLQSVFAEGWASTAGEILTGPEFYPPERSPDPGDPALSFLPDGDTSEIRHLSLATAPSSEDHPLRHLMILSFLAARRTIRITASYFVPDRATREALLDRARAGVDVQVLVPGRHTAAKPIRQAGRHYYAELLRSGVRIHEYRPTRIHAKHVVVDGAWSVVGSANLDVRSEELNHENVLGILDPGLAGELETAFEADLARSDEITAKAWDRRGFLARTKERLAVLFVEQY